MTASENKSEPKIEIVPTYTFPGNTASEYDIFVTPDTNDNFTLSFNLKGEYSGQSYFYVGNQIRYYLNKLQDYFELESERKLQQL